MRRPFHLAVRALPAVLLIVLACASARTILPPPGGAGVASLTRPIEILFGGDMRGKIEPCG